jgi:diguanylate cyclase (GGDEF)-like protein
MRHLLAVARHSWQRCIQRLVPSNLAELPMREARRARTLAHVLSVCIAISALLVPYYVFAGLWEVALAQCISITWYAMVLLLLRSGRATALAQHVFVFGTFLMCYGLTLFAKQDPDISPEWLLPTPLIALALCGPRGGVIWLGVGLAAVAIRFAMAAQGVALPELFATLPGDPATRFASVATAMVIVFVLNSLYEYDQRVSIGALERSHVELQRQTEILEASSDFVFVTDADQRLLYANTMARREFDLDGPARFGDLVSPSTPIPSLGPQIPGSARSDGWRGEVELVARKRVVPVSVVRLVHRSQDGAVQRFSIVARDISEQRAAERQLAHRATHDWLTDLPGRALFLDRVTVALRRLDRFPGMVAVLFIDLDGFKEVNDGLGHEAGDRLLLSVADRLRAAVRGTDAIARFGGDEFVALCDGLKETADARIVADRFQRSLGRPFQIGSEEVTVGASIGIALSKNPKEDPACLIARADAAMYRVKSSAKGGCAISEEDAPREADPEGTAAADAVSREAG